MNIIIYFCTRLFAINCRVCVPQIVKFGQRLYMYRMIRWLCMCCPVFFIRFNCSMLFICARVCQRFDTWRVCYVPILPEHDNLTLGYFPSQFCLSSVCRLSFVCLSVTFVHLTQPIEFFGNISTPFCIIAIQWPPCKILRILYQENLSNGGKTQEG